jgi:hypothetical protein
MELLKQQLFVDCAGFVEVKLSEYPSEQCFLVGQGLVSLCEEWGFRWASLYLHLFFVGEPVFKRLGELLVVRVHMLGGYTLAPLIWFVYEDDVWRWHAHTLPS